MSEFTDLQDRIAELRRQSQELLEIELSHATWERLKHQAAEIGQGAALVEGPDEPISFGGVRVRQNRADKVITVLHKAHGLVR